MRGDAGGDGAPWIARRDELADAGSHLARGDSVVVSGEAGVGKSSLTTRTLAEHGLRAVTCRCFRSLARAAAAPLQLGFGVPIPVGDELWTAEWVRKQLGRRVLVVEDLQWADELTLAVVGHLVAHVPTAITVRSGDRGSEAALAVVDSAHLIELDPLAVEDGAALARRLHPQLRPQEARALADRCGGNPLLIEQLGDSDFDTRGLRSATVARLRRCGDEAWRGFSMIVRAGEPLPATWVPGLDALDDARLTERDGDLVRARHGLLAQVVSEHLAEAGGAAEIDREVAARAEQDGRLSLAARLYASAGDDASAYSCAAASASATERPGERAEMLHLAARHAPAEEAPTLAAEAVHELVRAGDYAAAAELIAVLPERVDATWCSLVGRVSWQLGDDDGALEAYAAGLAASPDGSDADIVLRCELARAIALTGGDLAEAVALAREALTLAEDRGVELARAWGAIGTVEYFDNRPDHLEHMRTAVRIAEEAELPDVAVRFTLVNNLVAALETSGDADGAVAVARRAVTQAEALHMRGWSQQLTAMAVNASVHRGDYDSALVDGMRVLDDVTDRRTADQVEISVGMVLVDLGRLDEARQRIERALDVCADDGFGRGSLLWLAAEERLWSGQLTEAIRLADESNAILAGATGLFGVVTAEHARSRAGLPAGDVVMEPSDLPVVAAVPHEVAGHRARGKGDPSAREHFVTAASLWTGQHRRGELRCRWLAADAAATEGPEGDEARAELLALETVLAEQGWLPLLGVVRRSLRERGVRRTAPRGRDGDLTLREREVLDLIGQGLSNEAIAVRLGLSPATVAAQVASARARLGAATRWQAAGE